MSLILLEKFCTNTPSEIRDAIFEVLDEKAEMFLQERRKQIVTEMFSAKFKMAEKVQRKPCAKDLIRESLQEITVNEARKDALDQDEGGKVYKDTLIRKNLPGALKKCVKCGTTLSKSQASISDHPMCVNCSNPKRLKEDEVNEDGDHWIKGAIKHPGALHRELGVPAGEKIPASKLNKAAHAGGKEGERARLAKTLKGMH